MNKELESLKIGIPKLKEFFKKNAHKMSFNDNLGFDLTFVYLDKALQRLEAIENANPSEAFECLEETLNKAFDYGVQTTLDNLLLRGYNTANMLKRELLGNTLDRDLRNDKEEWINNLKINTIKATLQKVQEQEKVLEIIKEKNVDLCILTDCDNVNEYNKSLGNFRPVGDRLTYEEFDLLKRWLGCQKD